MTDPVCICSRPIRDHAYLCQECSGTLERQIAELPALADEVQTTRLRQSRMGSAALGILVRGERPVPWDDRAAKVADHLHAEIVGWVRLCQDWQVVPEGPNCQACWHPTCTRIRATRQPADTMPALSAYLLAALPALRHRPEVLACADDLTSLHAAVVLVVDRRPEQTFYGPCGSVDYIDGEPDLTCVPCPADLYGEADVTDLTCERCAAEHKVSDVRAYLIGQVQGHLATATELTRFLTTYGQSLTYSRLSTWVGRGKLAAHGRNQAGQPTYLVGDVVALLAEMDERRGSKTA